MWEISGRNVGATKQKIKYQIRNKKLKTLTIMQNNI